MTLRHSLYFDLERRKKKTGSIYFLVDIGVVWLREKRIQIDRGKGVTKSEFR